MNRRFADGFCLLAKAIPKLEFARTSA